MDLTRARERRRAVGGRAGRCLDCHGRQAGAAGGYSQDHGLDRRLGLCESYVGAVFILMFHSVTDVQRLNAMTEMVLGTAAHAMAGRVAQLPTGEAMAARRAVGGDRPDHGRGGRHAAGRRSCHHGRPFWRDLSHGGAQYGFVGALGMVNFGPRATVPEAFRRRQFAVDNPNVTLMWTTVSENGATGEWIGGRMNLMPGPVWFLLPAGGVAALDAPGKPFHHPEADAVLFAAIEATVWVTPRCRVLRVSGKINDQSFTDAVLAAFRAIASKL